MKAHEFARPVSPEELELAHLLPELHVQVLNCAKGGFFEGNFTMGMAGRLLDFIWDKGFKVVKQ